MNKLFLVGALLASCAGLQAAEEEVAVFTKTKQEAAEEAKKYRAERKEFERKEREKQLDKAKKKKATRQRSYERGKRSPEFWN